MKIAGHLLNGMTVSGTAIVVAIHKKARNKMAKYQVELSLTAEFDKDDYPNSTVKYVAETMLENICWNYGGTGKILKIINSNGKVIRRIKEGETNGNTNE